MNAETVLLDGAEETGWNRDTMIGLLCEYIDNQNNLDAFRDFISQAVEEDYQLGEQI